MLHLSNTLRQTSKVFQIIRTMSDSSESLTHFVRNGKKILGAAFNYTDILVDPKVKKPEAPVLFLKPSTSYIVEGEDIVIPDAFTNVAHETELCVVIGKRCKNISVEEADEYIGGYCLGLDLTAFCDLVPARQKGYPWSIGKGFDTSTPVSRFIAREEVADCHNLSLWLKINGETRTTGNTKDLIYNSFELIANASKYMTLEPNDIIMTGTPKALASPQIKAGDLIEAGMGNADDGRDIVTITFKVK